MNNCAVTQTHTKPAGVIAMTLPKTNCCLFSHLMQENHQNFRSILKASVCLATWVLGDEMRRGYRRMSRSLDIYAQVVLHKCLGQVISGRQGGVFLSPLMTCRAKPESGYAPKLQAVLFTLECVWVSIH